MKKIMVAAIVFALPLFIALAPASSAAPEYEARVERPDLPLTAIGTTYAAGDSITIKISVTNTGTVTFGTDIVAAVFVFPSPVEPDESISCASSLYGLKPGQTVTLTTVPIELNIPGVYDVIATVLVDFDRDRVFEYPSESIAEDTDSFTVEGAGDYSASVEIVSITAAALGGLAAVGGALAGVRFF